MQAPSCPGKPAARLGGKAVAAAALAASLLAAAATLAGPAAGAAATAQRFVPGAARVVFVQTDNLTGNQVVAYHRAADGTLTPAGGVRERRSVAIGDWVPAVDQSRFDPTGHWAVPPGHWVEEAENRIEAAKLTDRLRSAVGELPVRQREVVLLRDVEGLSSEEVCGVLEISEGSQRVLLHRARSRLRQVLETDFGRS